MVTANYDDYLIKKAELLRQAEQFRLLKNLAKGKSVADRLGTALGRLMIKSGRGLLTYAQAGR